MVFGSLTGWYVGLSIAGAVVLVVVILVATILHLARVIGQQAREITFALDDCRANTVGLWDTQKVVEGVKDINKSAAAARGLLEAQQ